MKRGLLGIFLIMLVLLTGCSESVSYPDPMQAEAEQLANVEKTYHVGDLIATGKVKFDGRGANSFFVNFGGIIDNGNRIVLNINYYRIERISTTYYVSSKEKYITINDFNFKLEIVKTNYDENTVTLRPVTPTK